MIDERKHMDNLENNVRRSLYKILVVEETAAVNLYKTHICLLRACTTHTSHYGDAHGTHDTPTGDRHSPLPSDFRPT
jgi:hypothetical protein